MKSQNVLIVAAVALAVILGAVGLNSWGYFSDRIESQRSTDRIVDDLQRDIDAIKSNEGN